MLISERQFYILCEEYKLSPTERRLARAMLNRKTTNRDLYEALGKDRETINTLLHRILRKTHSRNRAELVLRFWEDSLQVGP